MKEAQYQVKETDEYGNFKGIATVRFRKMLEHHDLADVYVELIQISFPGSFQVIERPINDSDKIRFSQAYNNWKQGIADTEEGLALEDVGSFSEEVISTLNGLGINTLEALACVDDNKCRSVPNMFEWKQKAQSLIKIKEGGKVENELRKQIEDMREQQRAMSQELAKYREDLGASEEEKTKKTKKAKKVTPKEEPIVLDTPTEGVNEIAIDGSTIVDTDISFDDF